MTTPRIEFKYSWIYDQNWKEWIKLYRRQPQQYPSEKKIQNFIKKVEPLWRKEEKKILQELSKTTSLPWKAETIICYVVGGCRPFSDPLTIRIFKNPNDFIDTLMHELIHQLFTQEGNLKRSAKVWNYNYEKYKDESVTTKMHVPLHAIHEHIFRKFFGEKRLQRERKLMQRYPDYRQSWEIVRKEGYENIIREIRQRME